MSDAPNDEQLLARTAVELYALPPAGFIAERNARASAASDPGLTKRIRALPKPSVAAWVVNVFAQERADRLAQVLQLAAELREAQDDLDAATLARLGGRRRALTTQLAQEAVALASATGGKVSASTADAVQRTIAAAFFDPDASAAVASGRLVRELSNDPVDLAAVVGGGAPEPRPVGTVPEDEVRARRERKAAEAAVREAEKARDRAEHELGRIGKERAEAEARAERLDARAAELAQELERVRGEVKAAREQVDEAGEREATAKERAAAAAEEVDRLARSQ
ncbi:transposase [Microbacterium sp. KUDC0406]|uniref:transposase n=1 Tax=Microbacterium sp. KUDC0406 TaxID=2909588 RepID=UPI001F3BE5E7|nr:transposase [Microbacterium sp. KUDC0406]UJP10710.1 transposase [Microbacterium sp. KUDC0406]